MIATIDVLYKRRSFVVAFATEDDARRFIAFMDAHARETACTHPDQVYRLDPLWCMGQYEHRPLYAQWGLDHKAVLRMILELVEVRAGDPTALKEQPMLDMRASKENGTTFNLRRMPASRLN